MSFKVMIKLYMRDMLYIRWSSWIYEDMLKILNIWKIWDIQDEIWSFKFQHKINDSYEQYGYQTTRGHLVNLNI